MTHNDSHAIEIEDVNDDYHKRAASIVFCCRVLIDILERFVCELRYRSIMNGFTLKNSKDSATDNNDSEIFLFTGLTNYCLQL